MAFKKGQSGNPGGRSPGKSQLTNKFIRALMHDFDDHGPKVIERVREEDPSTYMRIIASFVPKDLDITQTHEFDLSGLSDEELAALDGILGAIAGKAGKGSKKGQREPDPVH